MQALISIHTCIKPFAYGSRSGLGETVTNVVDHYTAYCYSRSSGGKYFNFQAVTNSNYENKNQINNNIHTRWTFRTIESYTEK